MRLLIVDDDAGLRQSLGLLLGESGYQVEAESDPERALQRAAAETFDLILCDVRMPKMDGLTFLHNLMRLRPMPVVMVSSWTEANAKITFEALELGAVDFVAKPRVEGGGDIELFS